jgi:hypothetical protein
MVGTVMRENLGWFSNRSCRWLDKTWSTKDN